MSTRIEEDLKKPTAYPESTNEVQLLQTHISFIFITDDYVYKIKKPVNFGFLDFSTLEKRKYYCEKEVELNKRLSPDIYLDVVKVVDKEGTLVIDGEGDLVEYGVKMKKIPMDRLMEKLLEEGKLTSEMVKRVGEKISKFHENAATSSEIEGFGSKDVIKTNTDENFAQTENYIGKTITKTQFQNIKKYTADFYKTKKNIIKKRIAEKKIKDCHGDLHMQHICLTEPIIIFDCIEFNNRFRYSDTAADIAFLAMDLDFHEREDLSKVLIDSYVEHSKDSGIYDMLNFYKIYRAYVRGKVIGFQLDDPHIPPEGKKKAKETSKKYFALANRYVKEESDAH
jgi:aminoglycoside phosphotransferase family enzyme